MAGAPHLKCKITTCRTLREAGKTEDRQSPDSGRRWMPESRAGGEQWCQETPIKRGLVSPQLGNGSSWRMDRLAKRKE